MPIVSAHFRSLYILITVFTTLGSCFCNFEYLLKNSLNNDDLNNVILEIIDYNAYGDDDNVLIA